MRLINSSVYYHHQHHPSFCCSLLHLLPPPRFIFCTPEPPLPATSLFLLSLPPPFISAETLSSSFPHLSFFSFFFWMFLIVIVARWKLWDFLPLFPRTELQLQLRGEEDQLCRRPGEQGCKGKWRVPPIGEGLICISDSISSHIKAEAYFWTTWLYQAGSSWPYRNNNPS